MRLQPLEEAVLGKLLDGKHPVLTALRRQLLGLQVTERKLTGVGFFTTFSMTDRGLLAEVPPGASPFGDVEATISGLEHGAGFLLWLADGRVDVLEGYSYDEPWPEHVGEFSLTYSHADRSTVLAKLG
jgi:hypothetical protein